MVFSVISVVICTYNRAEQLPRCLSSFEKIETQHPWELIVVDNNSSDHTSDVVNNFAKSSSVKLKLVKEVQQGLGSARRCGVTHASYNIVALTDDDCYPSPNYIDALYISFEKHLKNNSNLGFIGGRVELFDKRDLPITIQTSRQLKVYNQNTIVKPGQIHGANFAFYKHVIEEVGSFDPLFGSGARFPCEDIDLMANCLAAGYIGIYDPDVVVYHDHGRRTKEDLVKLEESYDIGRGAFLCKHVVLGKGLRFQYFKYWLKESIKMKFKSFGNEFRAAKEYARCVKSKPKRQT